jgi:septal ring factor EnvC (AmiA/AmiB activator)
MGCTNSKLESDIVEIKKELSQQAIEQNTLQVEILYLMNELKTINHQLTDLEVFKEQFQEL